MMRFTRRCRVLLAIAAIGTGQVAVAQTPVTPRVEFAASVWSPPPRVTLSSATTRCSSIDGRLQLAVACSEPFAVRQTVGGVPADLVNVLGLDQRAKGDFRATLKLIARHRARFAYTPAVSRGLAVPREAFLLVEHGSM